VPNTATNVIPAMGWARLNIRFNPAHTGASLVSWIEAVAADAAQGFKGTVEVAGQISGEAFLTGRSPFTALTAAAVAEVAGREPELSTTGGTSDARFIRALCPVVELGLVGTTMHAVDERVPVDEIGMLQAVYAKVIARYFETF